MLEILGVVFLLVLALIAAFVVWVGVKVYRGSKDALLVTAIEEGLDAPDIELVATPSPEFVDPDAVAALAAAATRAGGKACGSFDIPAANARLLAFAVDTPPAYIAVYDHDQVEPWVDVFIRLGSGNTFTASTVPEIARGAPRPATDEMSYFAPGTELAVLVRAAGERGAGEAVLPAPAHEFKAHFEAAAARSQECIRSGSVSQEWLESIARDAGVELSGSEAEMINLGREADVVMKTEAECLKSLAEHGNFSAAEWEGLRDRLVAVWDDMPDDYVSSVIYDHVELPEELEDSVDRLDRERGPVRERIARFNATLPEHLRLVRVGSVSSPVAADIYRDQLDPSTFGA